MSQRPLRALFAAAAAAALGLTLVSAPQATARSERGPDPDTAPAQARAALTEAEALFDDASARRLERREATLVLRDLVAARPEMSTSDRAAADRILARPTSRSDADFYGLGVTPRRACGTHVCVHWASEGPEASTRAYALEVLSAVNGVHEHYVGAGYRAPKSDRGRGGNNKPDVYLAQLGDQGGLYGYCTTDQRRFVSETNHSVWAYCVLDNDYSSSEYPANTPLENMRVTAAHEYMHAVQFAYDLNEDAWVMEATATWAEDEVFDDVDDNVFYLPAGQLGTPDVSLDKFDPVLGNHYGNWIWFRYLTEKYSSTSGGMPTLVRDVWRKLDSTNGRQRNRYSLQGIDDVLRGRGSSLRAEYAQFSVDNTTPGATYDEGAENAYPSPARAFPTMVLTSADNTHDEAVILDHMTSGTGAFEPAASLAGSWELRVDVDMAPTAAGSQAAITVVGTDGGTSVSDIQLDADGIGSAVAPFDHASVRTVFVTLVNSSDRMRNCYSDPTWTFACQGFGRDDGLLQRVSVTASN